MNIPHIRTLDCRPQKIRPFGKHNPSYAHTQTHPTSCILLMSPAFASLGLALPWQRKLGKKALQIGDGCRRVAVAMFGMILNSRDAESEVLGHQCSDCCGYAAWGLALLQNRSRKVQLASPDDHACRVKHVLQRIHLSRGSEPLCIAIEGGCDHKPPPLPATQTYGGVRRRRCVAQVQWVIAETTPVLAH